MLHLPFQVLHRPDQGATSGRGWCSACKSRDWFCSNTGRVGFDVPVCMIHSLIIIRVIIGFNTVDIRRNSSNSVALYGCISWYSLATGMIDDIEWYDLQKPYCPIHSLLPGECFGKYCSGDSISWQNTQNCQKHSTLRKTQKNAKLPKTPKNVLQTLQKRPNCQKKHN